MTHQKNIFLIKTRKIRFVFWVKSEVAERAKRAKKKTTQQKVKKEHCLERAGAKEGDIWGGGRPRSSTR